MNYIYHNNLMDNKQNKNNNKKLKKNNIKMNNLLYLMVNY